MFPHPLLVQLAHELFGPKEALGLGRQQELELELQLGLGLCLQVGVVDHDFVHELDLLGYTVVLVLDLALAVQVVDAHRQCG